MEIAASQQPNRTLVHKALKWVLKALIGVFVIVITFIVTLPLMMWWEHRTAISLPAPTGDFTVGRRMFAWTNEAMTDDLANSPGSKRQVLVWVWYPAVHPKTATPVEYLPSAWRAALAQRQGTFMTSFFKRDPVVVRPHSLSNAPVASEQPEYPVVLLRAGGSSLTTDFTTLAEDLASHGYFVVGFDAPYRSFVVILPDGRAIARLPEYNVENANGNLADPVIGKLLAMWISDTKFVVDQLQRLNEDTSSEFRGRMDLNRIGVLGHSFGGATALQFCHEDLRCKAAVDMDGIPFGSVVQQGLTQPCMFVLSDHSHEIADPSSHQVFAEIKSIYDRLPDGRLYVVIRTANHFSFSDQILLNSHVAVNLLRLVARFGGLDARRGLGISGDYVHTFFDVYLKGKPAASLASLSNKYQEVQIGSPQ
ncbi:MAG TPA: family membership [Terriglobia bacterium]|nr:family membership [Terriglobia bacterium]